MGPPPQYVRPSLTGVDISVEASETSGIAEYPGYGVAASCSQLRDGYNCALTPALGALALLSVRAFRPTYLQRPSIQGAINLNQERRKGPIE